MSDWTVGLMSEADLAGVLRVQAASYPAHLHESMEVLRLKLVLFPQSCWVVARDGDVLAYLFAHQWVGDLPPAFDAPLAIREGCPYFYLHDMAVHPDGRGQGLSLALWLCAKRTASALACAEIRLVAVEGAQRFWQGLGFAEFGNELPGLAEKLQEYGGRAQLMRYCL